MTVLLEVATLDGRRDAVRGPLHELSESLSRDLAPVLARDLFIPTEKARMTRRGGRCAIDGTMLEFDPFSPRLHRCPRCGTAFDDDAHYRWWIMGYQLWLAERAVHAATLFALRGDLRHRDFAGAVLEAYAGHYLEYPNADNVLGPTRPFFSTYLESIWLLQLIVALDLLETATPRDWHAVLGARLRDRVIEPSARLIAGYDEGLSNRQVWNNAALLAAGRVLDRPAGAALDGPSGLVTHLTSGLLSDGTWYEGENYHLFAHRGLWYGVMIAETAGVALDRSLIARFDEAFAAPFLTALPDFTFPSRRDSQYRVSLRQWRFAELAELGLARQPGDGRLSGALATLYDGSPDRHDTDRARSTAEAERNTPATTLDRADLGWRSLLFALPSLPKLAPATPTSVLMRGQGLAILRRDEGRMYAALDYGHSGSGHGHPDRLNVILVHGTERWLDDVGTGSYVDPSLHWYRSTLAHNAPLVDGRSQERVHGTLVAYEDRGSAGWVRARVRDIAPGVQVERTLVVMPTYLVDDLTWQADRDVQIDLPFHADGTIAGARQWEPAAPTGGTDVEDGFGFLDDTETTPSDGADTFELQLGTHRAVIDVCIEAATRAWWRATSFGAPGMPRRRFHFLRATGRSGRVTTLWDVTASLHVRVLGMGHVRVTLHDGTTHEHTATAQGWHIELLAGGERSSIDLGGGVDPVERGESSRRDVASSTLRPPYVIATGRNERPLSFELVEPHYRRSEQTWVEAGKPMAAVAVSVADGDLVLVVKVAKRDVYFAAHQESNPLDNEPADINSDGVQLHLIVPDVPRAPGHTRELTYVLVPEPGGATVRVKARSSGSQAPAASVRWDATAAGYSIRCAMPLAALGLAPGSTFLLGVVVNDMASGRERRRGQLVLGGADGEFVYLRGDRLPADRHLPFTIADG